MNTEQLLLYLHGISKPQSARLQVKFDTIFFVWAQNDIDDLLAKIEQHKWL